MEEIINRVNKIFAEVFGKDFSGKELRELKYKIFPQWDSLAQMTIITKVEETFGFFIPFDEMMAIQDYNSAIEYIQSKIK